MSGAVLEVEEAARGDLGGILKNSRAEEKAALELQTELEKDENFEVLTGPNGEEYPSKEDLVNLRRVHGHTSWVLYTIGFVELCERFAYYGTTVLYTNFVSYQLPTNDDAPFPKAGAAGTNGQSGALGLGQQYSTGLSLFSQFWAYIMPLLGGYIADQYLGKFKTIQVAIGFALVGHVLIIVAATPPVIAAGRAALAPYILGLILFGVGVGFFKTNISPLIAEQYEHENPRMTVKTLKSGERVIVDPFLTIARIYVRYYFLINIGCMGGQISMVYAEKYVGFWLAVSKLQPK
jgi:proton-dependent oligopeptide transporter, POT family